MIRYPITGVTLAQCLAAPSWRWTPFSPQTTKCENGFIPRCLLRKQYIRGIAVMAGRPIILIKISNILQAVLPFALIPLVLLIICGAATANMYYVSPSGGSVLSGSEAAPGSLAFALVGAGDGSSAAAAGDTIILEDGTYNAAPGGYVVYNSGVTLQAKRWHKAVIKNSTGAALISPKSGERVTGVVCQGIVFGPTPSDGWSGGGGAHWQFLDCAFIHCGGVGAMSNSLFARDLFSDAYSNAFDIGGSETDLNTGVTFKDCIARRCNRINGDDDSIGNKEDFTKDIIYDDLIAYDNNGAALWFDTDNDGWTIENSTFFGNHGGNNWYTCGVAKGISATQFLGNGQDGQQLSIGQPIKLLSGTPMNLNFEAVVTAVSGSSPQTITVSPALPAVPTGNDEFIVQQVSASVGDGFITEANDCGTFTNNVVYGNTDDGFFDHASGGSKFGTAGGLVVTNNLFAYDGEGFNYTPDGRDDGPAVVKYNQFKFKPGSTMAFGSGGGALGQYPGGMHIAFDYNVYDPDAGQGSWAQWSPGNPPASASGLSDGATAKDYLQNLATWNQDQHSVVGSVSFRGVALHAYIWPAGIDTDWRHVYAPNNEFGLTKSIHQIDDTDGAITDTIDAAIDGHTVGDVVLIPVSAHTPIVNGTCEIYDLNGRWISLKVRPSDSSEFIKSVSPYVVCAAGNKTVTSKIRVVLRSTATYNIAADYTEPTGRTPIAPVLLKVTPGSSQALIVWSPTLYAESYSVYRRSDAAAGVADLIASGITTSSYIDNSVMDGQTYYYVAKAVNSYGQSEPSNTLLASPAKTNGSIGGTSVNAAAAPYDLSALGTIDWRQWGDIVGSNSKASGGGAIGDLARFGQGTYGRWMPANATVRWSDSLSTFENNDDEDFTWCNQGSNCGWTFSVPADTIPRTLSILWGGAIGAEIKLDARLSDGSAPEYTDSFTETGDGNNPRCVESITYNSSLPASQMTITMTLTGAANDRNPSLDLMAAWLH